MSEDIFSQFFNLFNNDEEEVNWELAKQISIHLNKDNEEFIPELSNQNIKFDEIFRVVELNNQKNLITTSNPVELKLLETKDYALWFLESIKHFDFSNFELGGLPEGIGIKNIKSSITGMQLGNIAGLLSKHSWGLSNFGIILPKSKTLSINKNNFLNRLSIFEADERDIALAFISLEFTALSLGAYEAPFKKIITNLTESTNQMMEKIKDLDLNIDPNQISNPQEIFSNIPNDEGFDVNEIFESIMAPLSFYREAIKEKAKKLELLNDASIFDLVMDLSFSPSEGPTRDLEIKISELDNLTSSFFTFLEESKNDLSLDEILSNEELIPNINELSDPIAWAARTSLPPI
ncbi:MAG: hypothetical protein VYD43_01100 [Actinomycetota bacterium]|nr:hypothetical protein [Actinomycetota bacterium]|tara:strand:+ start:1104 stop:2150 length:1047 start_codon:yes stop_codon:yes gene_type:complete